MNRTLLYALGALGLGGMALMLAGEKTSEPKPEPDPEPDPPAPKPPPDDKDAGDGYTPPTQQEWSSFEQSLIAAGVTSFSAKELASWGGGKYGIPKGDRLVNFLKIARHAQAIRERYGKPLLISSAYRPWDEKGGNHELATAIDFDLPSGQKTQDNEHALRRATASYWLSTPELQGMGFYHAPTGRVHIDVNTNRGRRYWYADEVQPILNELKQA